MQFAFSLSWIRRLVVVGSVVACAAASAIGASASPTVATPDVVERYAATHDPNWVTAPDVLERYVTAHSLGLTTVVPAVGTARIVDDWYRDPKPVATPVATPVGDRIVDDCSAMQRRSWPRPGARTGSTGAISVSAPARCWASRCS